jgi:putative ABC transport system ATP-binding protein
MESNVVAAIEASKLSKTVHTKMGDITILHEISISVAPGESIAIVGSSGSGKTTLLSLLAGLDLPSTGFVSLFGKNLQDIDEEKRAAVRRDLVSFVFQSFQLIPELTALENVILPMEIKGVDRILAIEQGKLALKQVGLEHRLEHYPKTLSGGEQQRVALARAFVTKPRILFADEPTGSLDEENGQKVIQLLFDMNTQSGSTLVLVTHDLALARMCQKMLYLRGGQLVDDPNKF